MTTGSVRATLAAAALVVAGPAGALAQAPVSSFDELALRLRPGDTVHVADGANHERKGTLHELTTTGLVVKAGGSLVEFPRERVNAVRWQQRDSLGNGALIGFGVGFALTETAVLLLCASEDYYCEASAYFAPALVYGAIGAGIGVGIDALVPGRKVLVYERRLARSGASLGLSPILHARRQGVAVTLGF